MNQTIKINDISNNVWSLIVMWSDGELSTFNYLWLRDNCPSDVHPVARERLFNIITVSENIKPENYKINEKGKIEIKWNEGNHTSYFDPIWLRKNCYTIKNKRSYASPYKLWDKSLSEKFDSISIECEDIMESDESLIKWLEILNIYNKINLVPFGEYVPFPFIFKFFSDIFSIPMSNLSEGKEMQSTLTLGNNNIYPLICYEITFPSLINIDKNNGGLIVNFSNDAWFGNSSAPSQHLQIAQIRALETQRYILRSANTGISAIIDPYGNILNKIDFGVEGTLDDIVFVSKGKTPFMDFGDYPILMLVFIFMFLTFNTKSQENG